MRDYLNVGPVPCDEACQGVGMPNYDSVRAMKECHAYLRQIRRVLGPEPYGAKLSVKGFPHDYGTYHEVVCHYDSDQPESVKYAFDCEKSSPQNWDDEAKKELGL